MTREEAIRRIKAWNLDADDMEVLSEVIPELKEESEDEKIRKSLLAYIKGESKRLDRIKWIAYLEKQKAAETPQWMIDFLNDIRTASINKEGYDDYDGRREYEGKILAIIKWLEGNFIQQKEQKPVIVKPHNGDDTNPYDMSVSEAQDYAIKRGFSVPFNDGEVYVDERHITQTIGNILRWADEHPKEQKPAEWSEEDEAMIEGIIGDLCALKDWIIKYDTNWLANPVLKNIDKRIDWLKSLKDRGNFPKSNTNSPSEWSEEDKKMLGKVLECIRFAEDHYQLEQEETNGISVRSWLLDHIIPKPKQEWSEEDEHIIGRLRSIVQWYAFGDNALDVNGEFCEGDYAKLDDWLKSLQPQAKQEQNTLEYLPKEKVYDIMSKLTNLSFSKLIPFNSKEYKKIDEITADVCDLLYYPIEKKENLKSSDSIPPDCVINAKCEDRWRKVEESLPDNGRLVLAKDNIGNILLARYDGENWEVDVYDNEDYYCRNFITKWCEIPFEVQKEQTNMDLTQQKNEAKL